MHHCRIMVASSLLRSAGRGLMGVPRAPKNLLSCGGTRSLGSFPVADRSNPPNVKLLINGEFVDSNAAEWVDVTDPATQDVVSRLPLTTASEFNAAVGSTPPSPRSSLPWNPYASPSPPAVMCPPCPCNLPPAPSSHCSPP